MEKVIVKFTGSWRGYSAGEVAGFTEDLAKSLVDGGRAEVHEVKKGGKPATRPKSGQALKDAPQPGPSPESPTVPDPDEAGEEGDEAKP